MAKQTLQPPCTPICSHQSWFIKQYTIILHFFRVPCFTSTPLTPMQKRDLHSVNDTAVQRQICRLPLATNSTKQSTTSEACSSSASRELSCILWNSEFHFCANKNSPPVPVLSLINPVQNPQPIYWISIEYLLILSSQVQMSSKWPPSFRFPHQTLYARLLSSARATGSVHLTSPDW